MRELFLAPAQDAAVQRPTREDLKGLPPGERRRRKVQYTAQGGVFRTWVYVATLIAVVGGFAVLISIAG